MTQPEQSTEEFTTMDNHTPSAPLDGTITTLDNHTPAEPLASEETITTMDNHTPAPPVLDLDR
ncbi:sigma-like protein [Streptomyces sp. ADMS]|uniref:sigma-like protein n=1 Tax=Streptomyces sp. ADMS TaxID=3071415 RepID=UPI00296FB356|nr:sigma-like protein [Streptomyces sp. ADMS]MDW4903869.1 sigma-like protein [Streptomyces sp. ADMS]